MATIALLGLEALLWFLLAKTYSRGALVAAALAATYFICVSERQRFTQTWRIWILRSAIASACVIGTGFAGRLKLGELRQDGAVEHRLALWKGGLQMMAAAPWQGWGAGESGRAYMNWFEPLDHPEGFSTMVNSYLDAGVEHGLPALAAVLAMVSTLLIWAWLQVRRGFSRTEIGTDASPNADQAHPNTGGGCTGRSGRRTISWSRLIAAAGASIVVWAVANVFTTLWIVPMLWIVPGFATMMIIMVPSVDRSWHPPLSALVGGVSVGVTCAVTLWLAGMLIHQANALRIHPLGAGVVRIARKNGASGLPWKIWPDFKVLGRTPGKEIRRWMATAGAPVVVVVHFSPPLSTLSDFRTPRNSAPESSPLVTGERIRSGAKYGVMLFGNEAERLGRNLPFNIAKVVLVNPRGRMPAIETIEVVKHGPEITLILPQIDQVGDQRKWLKWAQDRGARVIVAAGVGEDIRADWPRICEEGREGSLGGKR